MRKLAVGCGYLESLALVVFGISVLLKESTQTGVRGSGPHPAILFVMYLIFAFGLTAVTNGIARRSSWAKTPFGLIQVFALLVFAYLPLSGTGTLARLSGGAVAFVAGAALVSLWKIRAEN